MPEHPHPWKLPSPAIAWLLGFCLTANLYLLPGHADSPRLTDALGLVLWVWVLWRLVGSGLISRQEDPEDRRNKRLTLTPDGMAYNEEIERVYGREFADLVATLGASRMLAASVSAGSGTPITAASAMPSMPRSRRVTCGCCSKIFSRRLW